MLWLVQLRMATLAIQILDLICNYGFVLHSGVAVQTLDLVLGDVDLVQSLGFTNPFQAFLFEMALVTPIERYCSITGCYATMTRLAFNIEIIDTRMVVRSSFSCHRVA